MPQSRRDILQKITFGNTAHAGLWLDKFHDAAQNNDAKRSLVEQVSKINSSPYPAFFKRWQHSLEQAGAKIRSAEVQGRLAINLGTEAVLETSIALHHTYGVPYIPGSALKGLAAHYAVNHLVKADWGMESDAHKILFGDAMNAGYVIFFDALYVPDSGINRQALLPDVITVHHPQYYQAGQMPPSDWDSPTPIPFLSATGKYLIALKGPGSWVKKAFDILKFALEEDGIGAKTSSGYGKMKLEEDHTPDELIWLKGEVRSYSPQSGRGKIVDGESREYSFTRDALLKGWSPPRGQKVEFAIVEGQYLVREIKIRYS
ncbi:MAG: type III-B CRISPR module RAMP protein Cmr6 [Chloroflexi bacterium]|nr:type III-B CRISPR module RAMP protein Cmr6 [Chloroflexota bacterium]